MIFVLRELINCKNVYFVKKSQIYQYDQSDRGNGRYVLRKYAYSYMPLSAKFNVEIINFNTLRSDVRALISKLIEIEMRSFYIDFFLNNAIICFVT